MSLSPLLISSPQNPHIKEIAALRERRERDLQRAFLVEGAREIGRALRCAWTPREALVCPSLVSDAARPIVAELERRLPPRARPELTPRVFEKLAIRDGSDGLIVVFEQREVPLAPILATPRPLIVALHGIEKPGNIGALLRSADGAGATALITLEGCSDPFAPQAVRASLGTLFAVPTVRTDSATLRTAAQAHNLPIFAAALGQAARPPWQHNFTNGGILLLGAEATGLPPEWLTDATARVLIPMQGLADSLNVAAAGAMLLYEAMRQRQATC